MTNLSDQTVTVINLIGCARCNSDHEDLEFERLAQDTGLFDKDGDGPYTHWAMCPNNDEPILLVVIEDEDDDQDEEDNDTFDDEDLDDEDEFDEEEDNELDDPDEEDEESE